MENYTNDVAEFATALWAADRFQGFYSPWQQNANLKALTGNKKMPSYDRLCDLLTKYKDRATAEQLEIYNDYMMHFDALYQRVVYSYANALSYDIQVFPDFEFVENIEDDENYKKDKARLDNFLTKFDYKKNFKFIAINLLMRGKFFTWLRSTKGAKTTYGLQVMPQEYCMITGMFNDNCALFDIDMNYFLQSGVNIDGYHPSIKKMFNAKFNNNGSDNTEYNPMNAIGQRDSQYANWSQCDPAQGAYAFYWDDGSFSFASFLNPILKEIVNNIKKQAIQLDKDLIGSYMLLAGEIGIIDDTKSGVKANQFEIKPETIGGFLSKAKKAYGDQIKIGAMPLKNVKSHQYVDNNKDMANNALSNTVANITSLGRVVSSTEKLGVLEVQLAAEEQYKLMAGIYPQLSAFMTYQISRICKKYKWRVEVVGSGYQFMRKERASQLKELSNIGLTLGPSVWASVIGMNPVDFERSLQEASNSKKFRNTLSVLLNTNTGVTGLDGDAGVGRAVKDVVDIAENTETSRDETGVLD